MARRVTSDTSALASGHRPCNPTIVISSRGTGLSRFAASSDGLGVAAAPARWATAATAIAAFLLVLALQLRFFHLQPNSTADDFVAYVANARALATGGTYGMPDYILNPHYDRTDSGQGAYPPGYPLALAPVVAFATDPVLAAALFNIVAYAGFAALLLLFALPSVGLFCAVGLALTAGLSPEFLNQGTWFAPSESFFLVVLMATLLSERRLHAVRPIGAGSVLLLGAMIAAAALTRVTGILLGPAAILADLFRRRRLAWPAILASGLAGMLFLAVIAAFAMEYVVQNFDVLGIGASATDGHGRTVGSIVQIVTENLLAMPGNLTALWTISPPKTLAPWQRLARTWSTIPVMGLILLGFILQARRLVSLAETYFVLQIGLLLSLTAILRSPRYWLPVSVLGLFYAVVGARMLGWWALDRLAPGRPGRAGTGAGAVAGGLAVLALAAGLAAATDAVLVHSVEPYSVVDAPAQEALKKIRLTIPPASVIIARRPRTIVFYTGRAASDYHLTPADPGFWTWVAALRGTHLVLSIDQADVIALARKQGLPMDDAGLRAALDEYEKGFFGPTRAGIDLVFDTGRYRLYRLVGPPPDAPHR
jgi:hypothetical protein